MTKSILSLTFLFLSLLQAAFGQEKNKVDQFKEHINNLGLKFHLPNNYTFSESKGSFTCGDHKLSSTILLIVKNSSDDVRIGFTFIENSHKMEKSIQKISPSYDTNKSYLISAKLKADTINSNLIFYDKSILEKLGFDDGGEYSRNCPLPFAQKYPFNRTVFFHKDYVADFEITFFALTKEKLEIELNRLKYILISE
ncbi:hypothetical protein [Echinicola salinicaeni]|uniref:hypothetical protein n=1 Tax=Echinicola salinicaeni TaxID=2762757 RepID=UPI0016456DBE|nr:hypothetical protein [Echinicola salinicaeni]